MRTYGTLTLDTSTGRRFWRLEVEPHVAIYAKRVFPKIAPGKQGALKLAHSPAVCRDLEWFLTRFPLVVDRRELLESSAAAHVERIAALDRIISGEYKPRAFDLALPPRDYQAKAAELLLTKGYLLLGDDVGLGKTLSGIATFCDPSTLPACVVTMPHLATHWVDQIRKFAPSLRTHVVQSKTLYDLSKYKGQPPDVVIISYAKLSSWVDALGAYCNSVVYDEIQELRRRDSQKYVAANQLSESVNFALGLSATPIYNYGGEIFNIVNCLKEGVLGTREEFLTEFCTGIDDKASLKDPVAFGSYLREQHIMLRRTRKEVGRELPPIQRIIEHIDSDPAIFAGIENSAAELARIIMSTAEQRRGEKMEAAGEFDSLMRQTTGLAKAPFVAAFVRMLLENGEKVVLFGWHRSVYDVWLTKLADYAPAFYTGHENARDKDLARDRFINGDTPLMIMSLRSGAGLDGLQHVCRTTVFGELDWSPAVLEQCIGRFGRDGQEHPVVAYLLLSDDGADPIMAEVLGLKHEQIDGLRDLNAGGLERLDTGGHDLRALAEAYLRRRSA